MRSAFRSRPCSPTSWATGALCCPVVPKLAKTLAVPVEELIGVTAPLRTRTPRRSPKILRHAERIQRLGKAAQRFVIKIIDVREGNPRVGKGDAINQ